MNHSYQQEERELLLIDYIYRVLSHWRSIIVAMVVCAVAFGGLKYFKDTKDLKAQQQAQENFDAEEQLEAMMSQLTVKEKNAVENVLRFENYKAEKEEYIDTAAIMKLDQSEVDETVLQYHVETEGNATDLLNAYKLNFLNDDVMKEIAEQSDQMEAKDVKAMVTATCDEKEVFLAGEDSTVVLGNDDSLYESLYITVRGFSKEEVMSISEIVKKAISDYSNTAQRSYGKHKVLLENTNYQKCMDNYVALVQDEVYNRVFDLQNQIDTMMKDFSDAQIEVINFFIDEIEKEVESESVISDAQEISISKVWIVVGAFFGLCIIAGLHFLTWIFGGQINSPEELSENYHIFNFGIYIDEAKICKHKVFTGIDKFIYHLCFRNRPKLTRDNMFSIILAGIVEKCKNGKIDKIYISNAEITNEEIREFCEQLIEAAEIEGVSLLKGDYPWTSAKDLSQMIQQGHVIVCESISNMRRKDINHLLQICGEYNVQMMGTVFFA